MYQFYKCRLSSSIVLAMLFAVQVHAEDANNEAVKVLPVITVKADSETDQYVATTAASVLKSDAALFETAQSVSVIGREQLDQKQASTLAQAIDGVAGVVSGALGRRGWDDFIIRGQTSSDQVFIDGLRQGAGTYVAAEISGMDQVQVLKGPASVNFGLVQPGGMVNLVTKRPQAESSAKADITYGSYNLKQGSFDLNYSPNESEKGAFRINGRVADQEDPTDYVYFKNYYISPSYNFDLGDNADLSIIASYQHREYLRQQGLPVIGSLVSNPNGKIDRSLYLGEPTFGGYNADVYRAGWTFKYSFDNGWNFSQNFAAQKTDMLGRALFARTGTTFWASDAYTTIRRDGNGRIQDVQNMNYSVDNSVQKKFIFNHASHDISIGIDGLQDKNDYRNDRYTGISTPANSSLNLDVYDPVYGQGLKLQSAVRDINRLRYLGVYLRDRIQIKDHLIVSMAGRHDWAETSTRDMVGDAGYSQQNDQKFTGNASVMYTLNDTIAPYVSYATSFFPVSGTDAQGEAFKPETGKQIEVGVKLQSPDQNIQGSIAWYDLRRQNVSVTDPNDSSYRVQRGEQLTRGIETELSAHVMDQLKLTASYAYTSDAKVSKDTVTTNIGNHLNNIPEHSYSLSTRYRPSSDELGWYVGAGLRGESYKTIEGLDVHIPAYTLFDTEAGYDTTHWGAQLSIRNLFDKDYYAGALNANIITLGNPRQINFTVKFKY